MTTWAAILTEDEQLEHSIAELPRVRLSGVALATTTQ